MGIVKHDDEHQADIETIIEYPIGESVSAPEELILVQELFTVEGYFISKSNENVDTNTIDYDEIINKSDNALRLYNTIFTKDTYSKEELIGLIKERIDDNRVLPDISYYFQYPVFLELPQEEVRVQNPMMRYSYTEYVYSETLLDYKKHDIKNYDLLEFEYINIRIKPNENNENIFKIEIKSEGSYLKDIFKIKNINNYLWNTTFLVAMSENYYMLFYDLFTKYLNQSVVFMLIDILRARDINTPIDVDILKSTLLGVYGGLRTINIRPNFTNVQLSSKDVSSQNNSFNLVLTISYGNDYNIYADIFNSDVCITAYPRKPDEGDYTCNVEVEVDNGTGWLYNQLLQLTACPNTSLSEFMIIKSIYGLPVYTYTNFVKSIGSLSLNIDKTNITPDFSQFLGYISNEFMFNGFLSDAINQKFKTNTILQTYFSPLYITLSDFMTIPSISENLNSLFS